MSSLFFFTTLASCDLLNDSDEELLIYKYDDSKHWNEVFNVKFNESVHSFGEWKITLDSTEYYG